MYTETTRNGYFGRLTGSIGGMLIGVLMIIGALILLWTNEGRSFDRKVGLDQAEESVVSVNIEDIGEDQEGKLIHTTGLAEGNGTLEDTLYGLSTDALKLRRKVEMYQWEEKSSSTSKDNLGGSETVTTNYTYEKVWSEKALDSNSFKEKQGHENPSTWVIQSQDYTQKTISIGDLVLTGDFVSQLDAYKKMDIDTDNFKAKTSTGITVSASGVYYGDNATTPNIGDWRVSFEIVPAAQVSVIGEYASGKLVAHTTANKNSVALLDYGTKTDTAMILTAQKENRVLTWILRALGMLLLFIGFKLLLAPIVILAKVVPFVSRIVGAGTSLVAASLAVILGGLTIALAWFATRPLVSGVILALVGIVVGYLWYKNKNIQK